MSENSKRAHCPICGRFAKEDAVKRYNEMVTERHMLSSLHDADTQTLENLNATVVQMKSRISKFEKTVSGLRNELEDRGMRIAELELKEKELLCEIDKLRSRSLFKRIFNRY